MLTTCPHCDVTFRTSANVLEAADGMVRCGDCQQVFDGRAHLVTELSGGGAPSPGEYNQAYISSLLSDQDARQPDRLAAQAEAQADVQADVDANTGFAIEQIEPSETDIETDPEAERVATSDPDTEVAVDQLPPDLSGIGVLPVEVEVSPPSMPRKQRIQWISAIALASCVLIAQWGWAQRNNPAWQPALSAACALLGCELPLRSEIQLIRSDSLRVRPDPEQPGQLLVDIIMTNYASFAQPLPAIELVFSDIENMPIAGSRIRPDTYLTLNQLSLRSLRPRQPLRLQFRVEDPGTAATNYRLYLSSDEPR